jgi:hypothetical protein
MEFLFPKSQDNPPRMRYRTEGTRSTLRFGAATVCQVILARSPGRG